MTLNIGTVVTAPIRPWDSADEYPAFYANDGLGGIHQVADITARDAISTDRRQEGMHCVVLDDGSGNIKEYRLEGGITNGDWVELVVTGVSSLNGLSGATQTLSVSITESAWGWTSAGTNHQLDVAPASASTAGIVSVLPATNQTEYFLRGDNSWQKFNLELGLKDLVDVDDALSPTDTQILQYELASTSWKAVDADSFVADRGYWSRAGTTLSPSTAGDDILMNTDEKITFRSASNYIYSSAASTLDVNANTTLNLGIAGSTILALYSNSLDPNTDNVVDLGTTSKRYKDSYLYNVDINTSIIFGGYTLNQVENTLTDSTDRFPTSHAVYSAISTGSISDEYIYDLVQGMFGDTNTVDFTVSDVADTIIADVSYQSSNTTTISDDASGLKVDVNYVDSPRINISDSVSGLTADLRSNTITEPYLNVSNSPSSGYYLGWDGFTFEWSAPSLGGSITAGLGINITGSTISIGDPAGVALTDPTKDQLLMWDDSATSVAWVDHTFSTGGIGIAINAGSIGLGKDTTLLTDPGADRLLYWYDTNDELDWVTVGSGLTLSGGTLTATAGTDEKVKATSGDTAGYLDAKVDNTTIQVNATPDLEVITADITTGTNGLITVTGGTSKVVSTGDVSLAVAFAAKGDLIAGSNTNQGGIVTVGTDGYILMADAASTYGVKWADPVTEGIDTYLDSITFNSIADIDFNLSGSSPDLLAQDFSHAAAHLTGGVDEIDGDQLDIDWNPTNYAPSVSPTQATSVDNLTAHLYGIDQVLAGGTAHLHNFTDLDDTPSSYSGYSNYLVKVNSGETELEFIPNLSADTVPIDITCVVNEATGITKGDVVAVTGATGVTSEKLQVSKGSNIDGAAGSNKYLFLGVASETKNNAEDIKIILSGGLSGINTSSFSDGDVLYMSTGGAMTNTRPTTGYIRVVGYVRYAHASGSIIVAPRMDKDIGVPNGDNLDVILGGSVDSYKMSLYNHGGTEKIWFGGAGTVHATGYLEFETIQLNTQPTHTLVWDATSDRVKGIQGSSAGDVIAWNAGGYWEAVAQSGSGTTYTAGLGIAIDGSDNIGLGNTATILSEPTEDKIFYWDDTANEVAWLTIGNNLSISTNTLNAATGGGGYWTDDGDSHLYPTTTARKIMIGASAEPTEMLGVTGNIGLAEGATRYIKVDEPAANDSGDSLIIQAGDANVTPTTGVETGGNLTLRGGGASGGGSPVGGNVFVHGGIGDADGALYLGMSNTTTKRGETYMGIDTAASSPTRMIAYGSSYQLGYLTGSSANDVIYWSGSAWTVGAIQSGAIDHNDTGSIQGGTTNEYYHLTSAEHTEVTDFFGATNITGSEAEQLSDGVQNADSLHIHTFIELSDSPANWTSSADKVVIVNSLGDALEFATSITDTQHGNLSGGSLHAQFSDIADGFVPTAPSISAETTYLNASGNWVQFGDILNDSGSIVWGDGLQASASGTPIVIEASVDHDQTLEIVTGELSVNYQNGTLISMTDTASGIQANLDITGNTIGNHQGIVHYDGNTTNLVVSPDIKISGTNLYSYSTDGHLWTVRSQNDSLYSNFIYERGRASGAAVQNGDILGSIEFRGSEGSSTYDDGVYVRAYATETWSGAVNGAGIGFYTNANSETLPSIRMGIDSAGKFYLGTTGVDNTSVNNIRNDNAGIRASGSADDDSLVTELAIRTQLDAISGASGIPATIMDNVGDIIVGTGSDTYDNKPVGTNDYVLMADSGDAGGMGVNWGQIVNASVDSSAAIAWTKLAAGTTDRVVVTNTSTGYMEVSPVTTTELGLLDGITNIVSDGYTVVEVNDTGESFSWASTNDIDLTASGDDKLYFIGGTNITLEHDASLMGIRISASGGAVSNLDDLGDVTITSIAQYDVLMGNVSNIMVDTPTGTITTDVTGLEFDDSTRRVIGGNLTLSLSTGYVIPTTTQESNWDNHLSNTSNPHTTTISNLNDTTISSVTDNEILVYQTSAWINRTYAEAGIVSFSSTPVDNAVAVFDGTGGEIDYSSDFTYDASTDILNTKGSSNVEVEIQSTSSTTTHAPTLEFKRDASGGGVANTTVIGSIDFTAHNGTDYFTGGEIQVVSTVIWSGATRTADMQFKDSTNATRLTINENGVALTSGLGTVTKIEDSTDTLTDDNDALATSAAIVDYVTGLGYSSVTVNTQGDNRIVTATGTTDTLSAESTFLYDSTTGTVTVSPGSGITTELDMYTEHTSVQNAPTNITFGRKGTGTAGAVGAGDFIGYIEFQGYDNVGYQTAGGIRCITSDDWSSGKGTAVVQILDDNLNSQLTIGTGGISLVSGQTVNNIESSITDDDTHIPTSGAVVDWTLKRGANDWSGFGLATSASDDYVLIEDADDSYNKKYVTVSDLTGGGLTINSGSETDGILTYAGTTSVDIESTLKYNGTGGLTITPAADNAAQIFLDTQDLDTAGTTSLVTLRRKTGTSTTNNAVNINDVIGTLKFEGWTDISTYSQASRITSVATTDWGTGTYAANMNFYAYNDTLQMTVNAAGMKLNTGSTVSNIQSTISDSDTAIPTSGAVVDYVAANALTNPMNGTGDIIYSSDAGGTAADLDIGSTGQVLEVSSGLPSWQWPDKLHMNEDDDITVTSGSITATIGASTAMTINSSGMQLAAGATVNDIDTAMAGTPTDDQLLTAKAIEDYVTGKKFVHTHTWTIPGSVTASMNIVPFFIGENSSTETVKISKMRAKIRTGTNAVVTVKGGSLGTTTITGLASVTVTQTAATTLVNSGTPQDVADLDMFTLAIDSIDTSPEDLAVTLFFEHTIT